MPLDNINKKIGLFGGTFNPIHYGHLRTAAEIAETFALDKIIFIPSYTPPLKKTDIAPPSDRFEMVKLAIHDNPIFEVSDIEYHQNQCPSYTLHTVEQFKKLYQNSKIYFTIGIDAFLDIHLWYQPDILLKEVEFIVIIRPPYLHNDIKRSKYIKNQTNLNTKTNEIPLINGHYINLVNVTQLNISSTDIRKKLKNGQSIKYLLPESVELFIIRKLLYKGDS